MAATIVSILLAGILTENIVFSKLLGVCPIFRGAQKLSNAFWMSVSVCALMLVSVAVTYPIYTFVLVPLGVKYLQTVLFILIIVALTQCIEMLIKRYLKKVHDKVGVYLPTLATNCAVLGIAILSSISGYNFGLALLSTLAAGLGFMLAMVIFWGIRMRVDTADIPEFLRGLPITLIAAAIVSLAFIGFAGL